MLWLLIFTANFSYVTMQFVASQ